MMRRTVLPALALLLGAARVEAHPSGGPAVAWPNDPRSVGQVVDTRYTFSWTDTNYPATPTGTVTMDWYYSARIPPTFHLGVTPDDLEGTLIVAGVPEPDPADRYTWDTSTVAPGSYFIWSRVNDLPGETSIRIIAFSRGVVTVAHPGDAVAPAVVVVQPNSPFVIADERFDVVYEAFDPDGTGRIELEAMTQRDQSDAVTIAADLPATRTGTFTWNTSQLAEGDWILKATLRDARSMSFSSFARFLLRIEHLTPPSDAGVSPDGGALRPDSGAQYDGGTGVEPNDDGGCRCLSTPRARGSSLLPALLLLGLALRRDLKTRVRVPSSPAGRVGSGPPARRPRSGSLPLRG